MLAKTSHALSQPSTAREHIGLRFFSIHIKICCEGSLFGWLINLS